MTAFTGTELAASENAWIPTRPASWQLSRLKWTVRFSANGIWGDDADGGYDDIACIRVADFDRQRLRIAAIEPTMRSIPRSAQQNRRLKIGDLLLEKSGGGGNQPVGVVVLYDLPLDAVCSNFVARVVVSPGNDSGFFTYLHASLYYGRVNTSSIKQTTGIQNLDADLYFDEVVALPPVHTQQAIADYLDEKTADLDALIEKKRKLLDLLDEERAALINQATTKGIDPNVPMKDSGIPWVGEMPAYWRVKRLRHISPQQSVGVVINPSTYVDDAGDIPFIYGGEVSEGEISIVDARRISAQSNRLLRKKPASCWRLGLRACGRPWCDSSGAPGAGRYQLCFSNDYSAGIDLFIRMALLCNEFTSRAPEYCTCRLWCGTKAI
ncbi:hypothetical protein [uncultured Thiodictyon sp.]|uniref:hypothetical protein n=1 Tax=uncultured Thiodictyon sp. TaxID=1846217 RepID=UPI0025D3EE96|nr:hypothetical protein [uncultured Thiodictyon sp.]